MGASSRTPSISVLFPAYNDASTIASLVLLSRLTVGRLTDDYEILVVNDGSGDPTPEVLAELSTLVPELRVLHHPVNRGYGAALKTGFAAATKDLLFYTDGDAQFQPCEIALLLRALDPDADYVSGYRARRADPFLRVLLGRPYQALVRVAFGLKLRDIDCDFRLFRRRVLQQVELRESNGTLCIELLKKLEDRGFSFREVLVQHCPRVSGRSQYFRPGRVVHGFFQTLRLWVKLVIRKEHLRPAGARPAPSLQPGVGASIELTEE